MQRTQRIGRPHSFTVLHALIFCVAALTTTVGAVALVAQVPGQNVNMVSGTTLPDADPFLQRQNEPSVAVSTRNPRHLLAGANAYRTGDLPGIPDDTENGDAWLGLYKSTDGGHTWNSTLLYGFPRDASPTGLASPLHGFAAAADPTVRAGANGLLFYSGIVFNRGEFAPGAVFVARFSDENNKENGDPFKYLGTSLVARENSAEFLAKPRLAVDAPRGHASCTINGHGAAGGNVYLVYTVFSGPGAHATAISDQNVREEELHGRIMFSRSRDCGATWSKPTRISSDRDVSQGATIAIDPATGTVYVTWRQFADDNDGTEDAIMVTHSSDEGHHFEIPVRISAVTNPALTDPDIIDPAIPNPPTTNGVAGAITNPGVFNRKPAITNLTIINADNMNGSVTDVTWTATNTGNTAAAYSTKLTGAATVTPPAVDAFEAATLDSSWHIAGAQFGNIDLSGAQNHTPGGHQSLVMSSMPGGQRSITIDRSLGGLTHGTATIYFYDNHPGIETLSTNFSLVNSTTGVSATLGTQDFDAYCYEGFVYDPMANSSFGPNASCGVFPGTQTTNISRTLGWHAFSISWDSRGTTLSIDDQQVFARAGTFNFDTIRLDLSGPFWRSDATYYFDDVSVRP